MSSVITISGWGQPYDALKTIVPADAIHIDYSHAPSIADFYRIIKNHNPDVIVGWSLGGQLALRAISDGVISPKSLVLLATPYQFVASKEIKCAMNVDNFNAFYNSFESDPVRTLKRFLTLISLNDSNAHDILMYLRHHTDTAHASRWLYWLSELESFSCNTIDFSYIPKTLAFHGDDDTVVDIAQTGLFMPLISNYTLETFQKCGHAPHLHNEGKVRELIKKHFSI